MHQEVILDALSHKFEGELAYHKANILVYLNNPVGIGEHPDVLGAIETEIQKMAECQEKLEVVNQFYEMMLT